MNSQCQQILKHLEAGRVITTDQAWRLFGCTRLAARCYELKQRGYAMQSGMVKLKSGRRVAVYSLS